jgi:uncharacterized protein YkwD/LysM repeat protein
MNSTLKGFLVFLVLLAGMGMQPIRTAQGGPAAQASPSDLIAAVNALRASNGLLAYTVSPILMQTAQGQADYMAATGTITHSGPGGISLTQRLLNAGYPLAGDLSLGGLRAENITGGPNKTASQAVQEWTGDAPHLNTMLSPNLQEIGAGAARAGEMVYLVIDCALPTTSGQPQAYTPAPGEAAPGTYAPSDFIVPVTTSTPDQDGKVYHEVQYGQTLWSLAIAYGVKIDEIRALNNLGAEETIYQGERLLVRVGAPVAGSPTAAASETAAAPPTPLVFPTIFATQPPSQVAATPTLTVADVDPVSSGGGSITTGVVIGTVLVVLLLLGLVTRFVASRS